MYKNGDPILIGLTRILAQWHFFDDQSVLGFFRRSVRFQKLYHCPFNRQCNISKSESIHYRTLRPRYGSKTSVYRNCCRACRFQKCILVGLDPKCMENTVIPSYPHRSFFCYSCPRRLGNQRIGGSREEAVMFNKSEERI